MKKVLLLLLAITTIGKLQAQNIYELKYWDNQEERMYKGLFYSTDYDNCTLYSISETPDENGQPIRKKMEYTVFSSYNGYQFFPKDTKNPIFNLYSYSNINTKALTQYITEDNATQLSQQATELVEQYEKDNNVTLNKVESYNLYHEILDSLTDEMSQNAMDEIDLAFEDTGIQLNFSNTNYFSWDRYWEKNPIVDSICNTLVRKHNGEFGLNYDILGEITYFTQYQLFEMDPSTLAEYLSPDQIEYQTLLDSYNYSVELNQKLEEYTESETTALHLIFLGATNAEDIGKSVSKDLQLVQTKFKDFAEILEIDYTETIVTGNEFSKESIIKKINNLKVNDDDIVVFVYSGHGFRLKDDTDQYPRMFLAYDGELTEDKQMHSTELFNMIKAKKPRLNIFITDCCNNVLDMKRPVHETEMVSTRGTQNYSYNTLWTLFMDSYGAIRVTSARPGQKANCDRSGGFLTTALIRNIETEAYSGDTTSTMWQDIIGNASLLVQKRISQKGLNEQRLERAIHITNMVYELDNEYEFHKDNITFKTPGTYIALEDFGIMMIGIFCILIPLIVIIILIVLLTKSILKKNKQIKK